jgi:hypothetical protein
MELLLDGFEDNGLGEAKAAVLNAGFAGLTAFQGGGGIGQRGLHVFDIGKRVVPEQAETGFVAGAPAEEFDELFLVGGFVDFGEGEIEVRAFIHDPVDQEAEVGIGAEWGFFHGILSLFGLLFVRAGASLHRLHRRWSESRGDGWAAIFLDFSSTEGAAPLCRGAGLAAGACVHQSLYM